MRYGPTTQETNATCTHTLGRVCGRKCAIWSAGPTVGRAPIPGAVAAAAPAGVEARRGGGGRGGFIAWQEREREKEKNLHL